MFFSENIFDLSEKEFWAMAFLPQKRRRDEDFVQTDREREIEREKYLKQTSSIMLFWM